MVFAEPNGVSIAKVTTLLPATCKGPKIIQVDGATKFVSTRDRFESAGLERAAKCATWSHAPMPTPDDDWIESNLVYSVRPD